MSEGVGGACPQHGKSDEMATPGIGCRVSPSSFPDPPPVPATAGARSTSPGPWGTPGRAVGGSWVAGSGDDPATGFGRDSGGPLLGGGLQMHRNRHDRHLVLRTGDLRGRPRRRFTVSILPLMKSCPPHTPNNSRRSSAASRHSANTEQSAHTRLAAAISPMSSLKKRSAAFGTARHAAMSSQGGPRRWWWCEWWCRRGFA